MVDIVIVLGRLLNGMILLLLFDILMGVMLLENVMLDILLLLLIVVKQILNSVVLFGRLIGVIDWLNQFIEILFVLIWVGVLKLFVSEKFGIEGLRLFMFWKFSWV